MDNIKQTNKQQKTSENNRHHHQIQYGKLVSIYTLVMIYTSSKTHTVYHNTTAKIHCIKWISKHFNAFWGLTRLLFELGSWIFFSFIFLSSLLSLTHWTLRGYHHSSVLYIGRRYLCVIIVDRGQDITTINSVPAFLQHTFHFVVVVVFPWWFWPFGFFFSSIWQHLKQWYVV